MMAIGASGDSACNVNSSDVSITTVMAGSW